MVKFTPKLKDQPKPFFLDILRARVDPEGGHIGLAAAITRAYRANIVNPAAFPKRECIDRRKLRKLIKHDREVTLSLVELEALHAYLAMLGMGLTRKPFFTHSSIVQDLADLPDATFMLGTSMSQEGPDLSHWDIQAMARIQRTVNEFSTTTFDLMEVPRTESDDTASAGKKKQKKTRNNLAWTEMFGPQATESMILIGSERSNEGTRVALSTMLGLQPGQAPQWDELPFYFVLFDKKDKRAARSVLSRPLDDLPKQHAQLARDVRKGVGWGLIAGDKKFVSDAATRSETKNGPRFLQDEVLSHGVIAAQRQKSGLIWVIIAGLTGPGTIAAASQLSGMSGALPQTADNHPNAILWGVVETIVDTTGLKQGGQADLGDPRFVIEPRLWDPRQRCAIA
jgi:hypothetical protein